MSSDPNQPFDYDAKPVPPREGPPPTLPNDAQVSFATRSPTHAAALAMFALVVGGVVFLYLEKRNQFVRFWAMQSIVFGIAWFAFWIAALIIGTILSFVFLGWIWFFLVRIVNVGITVVWLFAVYKALTGKAWEIPGIGVLARQQLGKAPPV